MLESETFLGKDSTFSDEKLQRKEEYISQNEIFGINRHVLVLSLCAAFNSVIIGFNLGVFGGVVFVLQDYMNLDTFQSELLIGMLNFVAIFGSIVAGYTSDKYGRLKTFIFASVLFFIGGLVLILSSNFFALISGSINLKYGVPGYGVNTENWAMSKPN